MSHVALLPDTHTGYGMPIGGVVACRGAIIPNAVGVDIGCGVAYVETGVMWERQDRSLLEDIVQDILRAVPTGFSHHKRPQKCEALDKYRPTADDPKELLAEIDRGYYQVGTLGSGNHFIELQRNVETNELTIMVHSGSRNFGYKICNYYARRAKAQGQPLRDKDLAYFSVDSPEGKGYLRWMNLALDFARENRKVMLERVQAIVADQLEKHWKVSPKYRNQINAHHNYASLEEYRGKSCGSIGKGPSPPTGTSWGSFPVPWVPTATSCGAWVQSFPFSPAPMGQDGAWGAVRRCAPLPRRKSWQTWNGRV